MKRRPRLPLCRFFRPKSEPLMAWLPGLLAMLVLSATAVLHRGATAESQRQTMAYLDLSLANAVARLQQRASDIEQLLNGVAGLVAAAGMDRRAFEEYSASLHLEEAASPISGLGLLVWQPASGSNLTPLEGAGAGAAPLMARLPASAWGAPGFDAWRDPRQRAALIRACDTGTLTVVASDSGDGTRDAYFSYLPLYAPDLPRGSPRERRAALLGWVGAAFHVRNLMESLYGEEARELRIAIHEGIAPTGENRLYESVAAAPGSDLPDVSEYLELGGHTWTVVVSPLPAARYVSQSAAWVAWGGVALAILLAVITALLVGGRARALRLAEGMTRRLHEAERHQLLHEERQRLMQDMHDGLGSSLMSALRAAEFGHLDGAGMARLLRDCIDDVKLTIDSLDPVSTDLLQLLAALRFRLEPRIEASGITLHWAVTDLPTLTWLTPGDALNVMRILQEIFANVAKHTQATEIHVTTRAAADRVTVCVVDNGQGFDVAQALAGGGRGLPNLMRRAAALGGEVQWQSGPTGTHFCLSLPLRREA